MAVQALYADALRNQGGRLAADEISKTFPDILYSPAHELISAKELDEYTVIIIDHFGDTHPTRISLRKRAEEHPAKVFVVAYYNPGAELYDTRFRRNLDLPNFFVVGDDYLIARGIDEIMSHNRRELRTP